MGADGEDHIVADKLLLGIDAVEVSQPLAMGQFNQLQFNVWIESASTSLAANPVVVQAQTSMDLDTWTTVSSLSVSLSSAPKSGSDGSGGATDPVPGTFVRLMYEGGGAAVLLGASIRIFHA